MRSYTRALLFAGTCLVLVGCGNSGAWLGVSRHALPDTGWQQAAGPLPDEPHISSATAQIDGTDFGANGGNIAGEPPQVTVDASTVDLSWVRYGLGIPAGGTLNSISLDLPGVSDEYWVGLSNYGGLNAWEWYGPYDDNAVITPQGTPADYLSGTRNLYWVVLATRGNSFTLSSSTVDYDYEPPVLYHVPPPDTQTITTEASAYPSLIRLPAIDGISEDGAPLVFYTDVTAADTYVAYYDGEAWTSRRLFPDGPAVLMATARLSQYLETSQLIVAAYDPLEDKVIRSTLTPELDVLASGSVGNDPTGTITALALDCQDSAIWCVAQARRSETSSLIGASYDDLTESIKFPYTAELPDEEIAGLDVTYEKAGPSFYRPVVAYSHGTIDTSDTILLDFNVTVARPPGQPWD